MRYYYFCVFLLRRIAPILILLLSLAKQSYAYQDSLIVSIDARNISIETVFRQIEKQTGVIFYYAASDLNGNDRVSLQLTKVKISTAMDILLKGKGVNWIQTNGGIVIRRKAPEQKIINRTEELDSIPKVNISGTVTDKSGVPIPSATVSLRGYSRGQGTNRLGQFSFTGVPANITLIISSIGYETKQYKLSGEQDVIIRLDTLIQEIRPVEVVSTGYQEISKERTAGSFVQIDNELFNRRVGATVLDRLNDVIPGYLKKGSGGNPLTNYTIRGISTINASTALLLVVDNFIYDGDPDALNPNDIESVTILKDATASSIWGVRAGNGVIVVTTKKGKINRTPSISFVSNFTLVEKPQLSSMPSVPSKNVIDVEKRRFESGYYNQSLNNTRTYPLLSPVVEVLAKLRSGKISQAEADKEIEKMSNHDIRDDINKYLLQTAIAQQYSVNISGGNNTHQYYGSIGYDRYRPNDININNERLSLRFNNKWRPMDKLTLTGEINWIKSTDNSKNSLGSYSAVLNNPYAFLADEQGNPLAVPFLYRSTYVDTVSFPGKLDWKYVPLNESKNGNRKSAVNNIRIVGGVNYKIFNGLSAEVTYQWQTALTEIINIGSLETFATRNIINQYVTKAANGNLIYPYPLGATYTRSNGVQSAWNIRGQLSFDRGFGLHQITSILGFDARESKSETIDMATQYGYNQFTNVFQPVQYGTWTMRPTGSNLVINPLIPTVSGMLNRFGSIYLNAGYVYNQKYIFNASGRIDQSNFFGVKANDRRVPLWSVGGAWNVANENFYSIAWLPVMKLRATYGYSGNVNAGISPLATIRYVNPDMFNPVFVPFASIATTPNPQLRWERVETINLALEASSKGGRVSGSIELYQKRGLDLISQISVAPSSGLVSYTGNNSSIKGKGVDVSINTVNLVMPIKWATSIIWSYNEEKVTSYSVKLPTTFVTPSSYSLSTFPIINKPLSKLYSYQWAGISPNSGDAQLYVNHQKAGSNDRNKAVLSDYIYHGRTLPPYFGAIRNDFSWNNISLSLTINYGWGHYFRRESFSGILGSANTISTWVHNDYLNAWKKPGDELVTNVPGFLDSYPDSRYSVYTDSDILVEKGDFLRLQDVRLNYTISKQTLRRLPAKSIMIYIYANNLGFLWKASAYNPDTRGRLLDVSPQKSISFGLNASF